MSRRSTGLDNSSRSGLANFAWFGLAEARCYDHDTLLTWDEGYTEHKVAVPTLAEVEARIAGLNGRDRTLVTVYCGDAHIAVGGSAASGLVVYCTDDNESFWQLISDGDAAEGVTVVAGGQSACYPANQVTMLDDAKTAAREFLQSGGRADSLRWEAKRSC